MEDKDKEEGEDDKDDGDVSASQPSIVRVFTTPSKQSLSFADGFEIDDEEETSEGGDSRATRGRFCTRSST